MPQPSLGTVQWNGEACYSLLVLLSSFLLQIPSGGAQFKDCQPGFMGFRGHCYRVMTTVQNWQGAQLGCETLGSNLVSITSQEEEDFIKNQLASGASYYYWIGLFKNTTSTGSTTEEWRTGWRWVDGSTYTTSWSNWNRGQPRRSDKYAVLYMTLDGPEPPHWRGRRSDAFRHAYICEHELLTTTSTSTTTSAPSTTIDTSTTTTTTERPWWLDPPTTEATTEKPWWLDVTTKTSTTERPLLLDISTTTTEVPWWLDPSTTESTTERPSWRDITTKTTTTDRPWWWDPETEKPSTTERPWWLDLTTTKTTTERPWWLDPETTTTQSSTERPWWWDLTTTSTEQTRTSESKTTKTSTTTTTTPAVGDNEEVLLESEAPGVGGIPTTLSPGQTGPGKPGTSSTSTTPDTTSDKSPTGLSTGVIIGIGAGAGGVVLICLLIIVICALSRRIKRLKREKGEKESEYLVIAPKENNNQVIENGISSSFDTNVIPMKNYEQLSVHSSSTNISRGAPDTRSYSTNETASLAPSSTIPASVPPSVPPSVTPSSMASERRPSNAHRHSKIKRSNNKDFVGSKTSLKSNSTQTTITSSTASMINRDLPPVPTG